MMTKKQEAIKIISGLPDSADFKDIMYQLYVQDQIQKGQNDISDGNITSLEDLENEVSNW